MNDSTRARIDGLVKTAETYAHVAMRVCEVV